eukprot:SAG11_NODE_18415_length_491_cov_14.918367_1_plen_47_part_01
MPEAPWLRINARRPSCVVMQGATWLRINTRRPGTKPFYGSLEAVSWH